MPEPANHQRRSVRLSGSRSTLDPDVLRQRQCKRDEAIRKKLEHEFKKRGPSTRIKHTKKTIPGTVSALQPSRGLVVKDTLSVMEAAQLMAAKKSDCILVVDQQEHLCGILTAKDIAYRVVATSNSSRRMLVSDIMTPNPICVTIDTNAHDALNLMILRNFRHVPVCSEEGDIFGILDITKCLYEALDKMERVYGSSQKLFDALEGVEKEWASPPPMSTSSTTTTTYSDAPSSSSSTPLTTLMMSLRDKMTCPDLTTLLADSRHNMVQVSVKTNVLDVARLMREHGTTAVLVMDHDVLAGIFCTKDLVLRVIAAGIRPEICSVVRVMTPEPETALPNTSILQALKKMHDGHYLNLPVVDKDKTILGLIDVLALTYATLELVSNM
ncbi:hypothetical protein BCR42DRAFT_322251 [Absidia repens]|uniref:CBS domain-containing protein n=1 Tax=Absidia repens TaxID=90262 RepID=A0A1X2IQG5_9FUNG|nr:hypothetical protein BCR42DRAFT_322251 [Absidia repens]